MSKEQNIRPKQIIQERGGIIRTADAIQAGIHPSIPFLVVRIDYLRF